MIVRLAACLLLLLSTGASSRALGPEDTHLQKDDLFAGADRFAKGAKEATEVNLDKNMLGLLSGFDSSKGKDADLALARKMDFVYVRSYEYPKAGLYRASDLDAFRNRLKGSEWSHVVKDWSKDEQTDVWVRTDNEGQFSELVVIDAEPTELDLVHLKGHMSVHDLTQAGAHFGAPQLPDPQLKTRSK